MFTGFSQDTLTFFSQLKDNNNKQWFDEHRGEYREFVQEPLKELVKDMGPLMLSIDPLFEIAPKRCISRINRDTRFSHDKRPYRPNMWISFKRLAPDWKVEPVFFFEIFHDFYRYGMGYYNVPRETMDQIREMIDERKPKFMKIHRLYKKQDVYTMEGVKYKRILNKELPDDLLEWYQRKDLFFVCNRNDDLIFKSELIDVLIKDFQLIAPIYNFFTELK